MGSRPGIDELARTIEPQTVYDEFYAFATGLLDAFYPQRTVTVLMRAGRVGEALARQIGRDITRLSKRSSASSKSRCGRMCDN